METTGEKTHTTPTGCGMVRVLTLKIPANRSPNILTFIPEYKCTRGEHIHNERIYIFIHSKHMNQKSICIQNMIYVCIIGKVYVLLHLHINELHTIRNNKVHERSQRDHRHTILDLHFGCIRFENNTASQRKATRTNTNAE